jgi:hypothetical protein
MLDKELLGSTKPIHPNLDLLYQFRIEVNRLLTGEDFMSKLRKLTDFLGRNQNNPTTEELSKLEDRVLGNLMERVEELRKGIPNTGGQLNERF